MKVVLFCGGFGMRLREFSDVIPKSMVAIGYRPMIWHIMKYYAHFGHTDFILCLGYKADVIKNYFVNYGEWLSNDFTLSAGGRNLELLSSDIQDWNIRFIDTGLSANIGQRLKAVEKHLGSDEMFLANYTDCLTDAPLPDIIDFAKATDATASFLCVKPSQTFHVVSTQPNGLVTDIQDIRKANVSMNGGYFVFKRDIFRYIEAGEELVHEPFQRLIQQQKLAGYAYNGFWTCMDTFKEKQQLDDMDARGEVPWEVWRHQTVPVTEQHA